MTITTHPKPLRTLVVSAPGVMEDSLRALLGSFPQIDVVGSAQGCLTAHIKTQKLKPDLVIVDANQPESEVISLLQSFEKLHPYLHSIIFVNAPTQQTRLQHAGADRVLLRSSSPESLSQILACLHASIRKAA